ncbi:hypothetical protein HOLleu_22742 [Holothuria leucospilota]|uniref:Uncharacterized protein n=1 Tax=Holothuria leucospilota TaxID=206669 RepID=A0A9Q1BY14_HOLLE|nr:hypothetical protein HOLleu_22742 [Holothuria leucospilota]
MLYFDEESKTELEGVVCKVDRFCRRVLLQQPDGSCKVISGASLRQPKVTPSVEEGDVHSDNQAKNVSQRLVCEVPFYCKGETFVEVGSVCMITGLCITIGVVKIVTGGDETSLSGHPISEEGKLDTSISITVPAYRVCKFEGGLLKETKQFLSTQKRDAFDKAAQQSKENSRFRCLLRQHQIAMLLRREVLAALKGKKRRRTISLGIPCIDTDLDLFGLDLQNKRRAKFSPVDGTMDQLDVIFGSGWDILDGDGCFDFVSQVVFYISSSGLLNVTVITSKCERERPSTNVHAYVAQYMKEH